MKIVLQNWEEAGDMYRSNLSETKSSEEETCTENVSMSGSDIEVIDPIIPSTAMNELRLSTCNQIG